LFNKKDERKFNHKAFKKVDYFNKTQSSIKLFVKNHFDYLCSQDRVETIKEHSDDGDQTKKVCFLVHDNKLVIPILNGRSRK